eukprot:gene1695-2883_t
MAARLDDMKATGKLPESADVLQQTKVGPNRLPSSGFRLELGCLVPPPGCAADFADLLERYGQKQSEIERTKKMARVLGFKWRDREKRRDGTGAGSDCE